MEGTLKEEQRSRRQFLAGAASGVAALALGQPADEAWAAESLPKIPIIDPHQHLWDLSKFRLLWLKDAPKLNRSFLLSDYRKATSGLNIDKTVYMEVDLDPKQQAKEADWVIQMSENPNTKMKGGVISGRPNTAGFEPYIMRYNGNPYVKGVRQILHPPDRPKGLCLQPQFVKSIQLLADLGLRYDICLRPTELLDGVKLVEKAPKGRYVLDHCGNAELTWSPGDPARKQWEHGITEMAKHKNVICKISGIIKTVKPGANKAHALQPYVNHCLEQFGPNRVMFAGDWPVVLFGASYKEWVSALWWIVRNESEADKRKLFHDNANRFYEI